MWKNRGMCKNPMHNLEEAIKNYGLTIVGSKSCGKTNSMMCIISSMKAIPCVVDFATVHAFNLGSRFTVKFLNKNYLLKKPRININKPMIIDIAQTRKPIASEIIRELIKNEYYSRVHEVIANFRNGSEKRELNKPWLIFCLEEANATIGKFIKSDSDLATAMCVGRNYNIGFIFVTQRLAELNTTLSERTAYLIGKIVGDNNIRKLSRLLGISRRKLKFVETLPRGEFLFYNGERITRLKFPKYNGSRAIDIERQIIKKKPKSKNLWDKLRTAFTGEGQTTTEAQDNGQNEDSELEFDDIDSESEIEIDESEQYPEEWG